tara:strand:- start:3363 stop:3608 length:246 start_codon:yes stop_codon:yes gene_type:complete
MLDKTVQWNTHVLSGGVPVFGLNTKQRFAPGKMDNVRNEGGFNTKKINYEQYKKSAPMFSQSYNTPRNNDMWENSVNWAGQ